MLLIATDTGRHMNLIDMPGHLIRRLHQLSTATFSEKIKITGLDLTSVQFATLHTLRTMPGVDQATVAQVIAFDRATIGGVVDRLEKKGWIRREVNKDDRRARQLWLTAQGNATIDLAIPLVEELQADILFGLADDERQRFITMTLRILEKTASIAPRS